MVGVRTATLNTGQCRRHGFRRPLGFSLVELMIAVTVGLLLVTGLMAIYLQTSNANNEMARLNRQMENGRFALQLLREDLAHAGFWGEYSPTAAPAAIPDPCVAFSTWTASDKTNFLALPVYGYDDGAGLPASCANVVTNRQAGTDVLLVRRVSTCIADTGTDGNCENYNPDKLYLQVSLCSTDPIPYVMAVRGAGADPFILTMRDSTGPPGKTCTAAGYTTTYAGKRKVISHIYYIRGRSSARVADEIPTLWRSELDLSSGVVRHLAAEALIEGIEYMAVEYGVDSVGNDGSSDSFTSAPVTLADWGNVVAVKLHLLARALEPTPGHTDTKTYRLGETTLGPFKDGFNRHVYSTYIRLKNPSSRREK